MKIGELARLTGQTAETIRYYERIGLISAASRLSNNYREYTGAHVKELDFIRRCRTLGIGLEEIRLLLVSVTEPSAATANEAHRLISSHLERVREQIRELTILRKNLMDLAALCHGAHHDGEHCQLIDALSGDGHPHEDA